MHLIQVYNTGMWAYKGVPHYNIVLNLKFTFIFEELKLLSLKVTASYSVILLPLRCYLCKVFLAFKFYN